MFNFDGSACEHATCPGAPEMFIKMCIRDRTWSLCTEGMRAVNLGFGYDRVENALWRLRHGGIHEHETRPAGKPDRKQDRERKQPAIQDGLWPVSYTHLDVYKRQSTRR